MVRLEHKLTDWKHRAESAVAASTPPSPSAVAASSTQNEWLSTLESIRSEVASLPVPYTRTKLYSDVQCRIRSLRQSLNLPATGGLFPPSAVSSSSPSSGDSPSSGSHGGEDTGTHSSLLLVPSTVGGSQPGGSSPSAVSVGMPLVGSNSSNSSNSSGSGGSDGSNCSGNRVTVGESMDEVVVMGGYQQ